MILHTSAMLALLLQETEAERLLAALAKATAVGVGTPTLVETGVLLAARLDPKQQVLLRFLQAFGVLVIPFGDLHWREAAAAHERFGAGRHPAALELGDCLSYATASLAQQPLLSVGGNLGLTDLILVEY